MDVFGVLALGSISKDLSLPFVNADEIAKELDPRNTTGCKMEAGNFFFSKSGILLRKSKVLFWNQLFRANTLRS
jgi:hypothetical protein